LVVGATLQPAGVFDTSRTPQFQTTIDPATGARETSANPAVCLPICMDVDRSTQFGAVYVKSLDRIYAPATGIIGDVAWSRFGAHVDGAIATIAPADGHVESVFANDPTGASSVRALTAHPTLPVLFGTGLAQAPFIARYHLDPLGVDWVTTIGATGGCSYSAPALVANGATVFAVACGTLYAIDATSGHILRSRVVDDASPVVVDNVNGWVYVLLGGTATALDQGSLGVTRTYMPGWRLSADGARRTGTLWLASGSVLVIFNSGTSEIIALDPQTSNWLQPAVTLVGQPRSLSAGGDYLFVEKLLACDGTTTSPCRQRWIDIVDAHTVEVKQTIALDTRPATQDPQGDFQVETSWIVSLPSAEGNDPVVEFYYPPFDHYFMTADSAEITLLDARAPPFQDWVRTGQAFYALPPGAVLPNATSVCRFYNDSFLGKSSHFYAALGLGCEQTIASFPDWKLETDAAFSAYIPSQSGGCQYGTVPLYRLYNNGMGGAPNHRFVTSADARQQMIGKGWVPEGYGIGVSMCVPSG
jgi:hypothetical protein